jgi:peptide/nickel transport system ATP-binding protein
MMHVLDVRGLTVAYGREREQTVVVRGVDLAVEEGMIVGIAGESGCGKSTTALSAIGFRIPGSAVLAGSSIAGGVDLLSASRRTLQSIWGRHIAYVAQDAAHALNPLMRVEALLGEPLFLHLGLRGKASRTRAISLLEEVGIDDPEKALRRYPHQFSGGQQQRIALAIAVSCHPRLLVLDEPTTGLDVTTQAQIVKLIGNLVNETGSAAVMIGHDLSLLATISDELVIMYAGEVVERAGSTAVVSHTRHPYAAALLDAVPSAKTSMRTVGIPGMPPRGAPDDSCAFTPRCRFARSECGTTHPELRAVSDGHLVRCLRTSTLGVIAPVTSGTTRSQPMDQSDALLEVHDLRCSYGRGGAPVVADVNIAVSAAQTVAIVGESGSGKSTLLRSIAGLHPPEAGILRFRAAELPVRASDRHRDIRRAIQLVLQDPHASLNPRHTIGHLIERPLKIFRPELGRSERRARVLALLEDVRLDSTMVRRHPHQLSGGEKQRVALARAFAADPELILCDEVVSALDVSVQASILELLAELVRVHATALLFVTHDLAVVRAIADRVYVMRAGEILEAGDAERMFEQAEHQYTRDLLSAVPDLHRRPISQHSF